MLLRRGGSPNPIICFIITLIFKYKKINTDTKKSLFITICAFICALLFLTQLLSYRFHSLFQHLKWFRRSFPFYHICKSENVISTGAS